MKPPHTSSRQEQPPAGCMSTVPINTTAPAGHDDLRPAAPPSKRAERLAFFAFVVTFIAARILVLLIITRRIPNLYLHTGGKHVHHLLYGIFLLSASGAYLLFARPDGWRRQVAAVAYGVGLGLTFDEFSMWLHLGGTYWQRASFDAVVIIAAVLGWIAYAPRLRDFRGRHWAGAGVMALAIAAFASLMVFSVHSADKHWGNRVREIETIGPQ